MRVLHVIPGLSPLYGGPTQAVLEMCRALNKLGITADIATTNADVKGNTQLPLEHPVDMAGVTVYCFRCPILRKYGFSWHLNQWLKQHIREYSLLHIHALFSYITGPLCNYARIYKIPYIIRPFGQLDPWSLRKNRLVKKAYLSFIGKRCINNAAAIHFTSEDERLATQNLDLKMEGVTIPLGLNRRETTGTPTYTDLTKRYPSLTDKKIIVFLSRVHPKKGLDQLIPAIKCLLDDRDDFLLVIAGSGHKDYEDKVRKLVNACNLEEKVVFTGFVRGQDKWDVLQAADIFVLPSYDENFGLAVVEAMSVGVPVVISDHVGIHHEVAQWGAGLVTACDAAQIAGALARLLDDDMLRRHMGEHGKQLVREKFTWDQVATHLIRIYRSIVADGTPSSLPYGS